MNNIPKMYKSPIIKKIDNIQKVYSTLNKEESFKEEIRHTNNNMTIEQKIYHIFNAPNYIYKADVTIVTVNNETIKKRIVGKTKTSLITFDNEYIPISTIKDIY